MGSRLAQQRLIFNDTGIGICLRTRSMTRKQARFCSSAERRQPVGRKDVLSARASAPTDSIARAK